MARDTSVADALKLAAAHYWVKRGYSLHSEIGVTPWGKLRADLLGMNLKGRLIIIEVKSSVADFRSDKKMHLYLDYCNQMYLCTRASVYERIKDEIVDGIGVMVLIEDPGHRHHGYIKFVRGAKVRQLPKGVLKSLALRLAWRGGQWSKRTLRRRQRVVINSSK